MKIVNEKGNITFEDIAELQNEIVDEMNKISGKSYKICCTKRDRYIKI